METSLTDSLIPTQCRMARAGLRLSLTEALKASLASRATITRFESSIEIKPVLKRALKSAFEKRKVEFTTNG